MIILERIGAYFEIVFHLASDPIILVILFGSVVLGILFGAMPGLTSTLGVALLTTLTYGMDTATAMVCLLAIYVGERVHTRIVASLFPPEPKPFDAVEMYNKLAGVVERPDCPNAPARIPKNTTISKEVYEAVDAVEQAKKEQRDG